MKKRGFSKGTLLFILDINIGEVKIDFFPLDNDLLSLERNKSFRNIFIEQNYSILFLAARGIIGIQAVHGIIPIFCGKGPQAKRLLNLITKMKVDLGSFDVEVFNSIDTLVIVDRSTIFATPMMTQLTYEGLID